MTEAEQVMKRCQIGTRNYDEANNLHADCYRVIGKLLAEHAMHETQRLGQEIEQEPVAWRNAAIRVGEDLSSVGPDGYYDMTAQQWLDWAIEQEPRGKNELQAKGEHPAPCARHCEANAFKIVIKNLKAQLAQPEQEPFCLHWEDRWGCNHYADPKEPHPVNAKPLYITPPQRTDQEPVAWADLNALSEQINSVNCGTVYRLPSKEENRQPLYTAPPQRKPLSASEIVTMYAERPTSDNDMIEFARAIEQAHGIKENT